MVRGALVIGELALGRLVAYLTSGAVAGYLGMQLEGPSFQRAVGGGDGCPIRTFAPLRSYQGVATLHPLPLGKCTLFSLSDRLWLSHWYQRLPTLLAGYFLHLRLEEYNQGSTPVRWLLPGDVSLPPCAAPARVFGAAGEFASSRFDNGATFWCVLLTDGYHQTHDVVRTCGIIMGYSGCSQYILIYPL